MMLPILRRRNESKRGFESDFTREFDHLRDQIMTMFDRALWAEPIMDDGFTAAYPVDMYDEGEKLIVNAELPGFTKEQVHVSNENGVLHISAERNEEKPNGRKHINERRYERVERRLSLPAGVSNEKAVARLENGVLHLEFPKLSEAPASQITVT